MPQKTVTVTLKPQELKYDVMNKTYVTARSLQAAGKVNFEEASHIKMSEDEENSYEMLRALSDSIDNVKVELGEYLVGSTGTTTNVDNVINSMLENDQDVTLTFNMPDNYDNAAADALSAGIHDYLVSSAEYAWYRKTKPEIAEPCLADAAAALERARKSLYKRSRPIRPTYISATPGVV